MRSILRALAGALALVALAPAGWLGTSYAAVHTVMPEKGPIPDFTAIVTAPAPARGAKVGTRIKGGIAESGISSKLSL